MGILNIFDKSETAQSAKNYKKVVKRFGQFPELHTKVETSDGKQHMIVGLEMDNNTVHLDSGRTEELLNCNKIFSGDF